jgi:hypothetical protein
VAFSQKAGLSYTSDGIHIELKTIAPSITPSFSNNQTYSARLSSYSESAYCDSSDLALDQLTFIFAVPDDELPEMNFYHGESLQQGNIKIGSRDDNIPPGMVQPAVKIKDNSQFRTSIFSDVTLSYFSMQRGIRLVRLVIQPFDYNPVTNDLLCWKNAFVDIKFHTKVQVNNNYLRSNIESVFSEVDNKPHLQSLLSVAQAGRQFKKTDHILTGSWYKPDVDYVSIKTSKDGPSIIKGSDIISASSGFSGKQIQYLHLIYNGVEQYCYFPNDANGILDNNDEIFFFGRHPFGDTTWFDNYTNYAVFYLYYDETAPGKRFTEFPALSDATERINSVKYSRHFEKDYIYTYGSQDLFSLGSSQGEGWYWDTICPANTGGFNFYYPVLAMNNDDSISIRAQIESVAFDKNQFPNHHIIFKSDYDTIMDIEYRGGYRYWLEQKAKSGQVFSGFNNMLIMSIGYINTDSQTIYPNDIGIDYIELNGTGSPEALNGECSLTIATLNNDSYIEIQGFSSNKISIIDTLNNLIKTNAGSQQGVMFRAGSKSGYNPLTIISINDSMIVASQDKGWYIGSWSPQTPLSNNYKYYPEGSTDFVDYIKSIKDNSAFVITFNGDNPIPSDVLSILNQLGAKKAQQVQANIPYVLCAYPKSGNQPVESLGDKGLGSVSTFFQDVSGMSYSMKQEIQSGKPYDISIIDDNHIETAKIEKVNNSDLLSTTNSADFIVITHKTFLNQANDFTDYRAKHNNLVGKVVDVDDIYTEFLNGRKHPLAIKNFLNYILANWQKIPTHIVLYGDASVDPRQLYVLSKNIDYVPTLGVPNSDYWYVLPNDNFTPNYIIGRIPVKNDDDCISYLNKLKEYDTTEANPWMKNFFFMSGGYSDNEKSQFLSYVKDYASLLKNSPMCVDTEIVNQRSYVAVGEDDATFIRRKLNDGAAFTGFLGHGSAYNFDMDGWNVEKLNNKGKYGYLMTMSCNSGAFADPTVTARNELYMLYPDKGFIGCSGNTTVGFWSIEVEMARKLFVLMSDTTNRIFSLPALLNQIKSTMYWSQSEILTSLFHNFLGDPLVNMYIEHDPDLYSIKREITVQNSQGGNTITDSDPLSVIEGDVYNLGFQVNQDFTVLLTREYKQTIDTFRITMNGICASGHFRFEIPVICMPGTHIINILIDPDSLLSDPNRNNNLISLKFEVLAKTVQPVDPMPFWSVDAGNPTFRVVNPFGSNLDYDYFFYIYPTNDISSNYLYSSNDSDLTNHELYIDWKPGISLEDGKTYWLYVKDKKKNDVDPINGLWVPFHANQNADMKLPDLQQNSVDQFSLGKFDQMQTGLIADKPIIELKKDSVPFYIGGATYNQFVEISIGERIIDVGVYVRGFHIAEISPEDLSVVSFRYYDTWGIYPESEMYKDSTTFSMLRYLRDSINPSNYIMVATCEQSLRLLLYHNNLHNIGSLDTLKSVLREYGAALTDSLAWGASYALFGKRGSPVGSVPEVVHTNGDSSEINGYLPTIVKTGTYSSPVYGPSIAWRSLKIDGLIDTNQSKIDIKIYAQSRDKTQEQLLIEQINNTEIDLSSIPADQFPYIRFEATLTRFGLKFLPYITAISCDFDPAAELALSGLESGISSTKCMRGDSVQLNITAYNISKRATSAVPVGLEISSSQGIISNDEWIFGPLIPDSKQSISKWMLTDNFNTDNNIDANVNNSKVTESYSFNNKLSWNLNVAEDTIKPGIYLMIDGKEVKDGDWVSVQPVIHVELWDSSLLPVVSPDQLRVRINSIMQTNTNTVSYEFNSYGRGIPIKASVILVGDSLDFGDNIIKVYAMDATGNRDTLSIRVNVSLNAFIENFLPYPNPMESVASFGFYYKAPELGGNAIITIFNLNGQKLKTLTNALTIGANSIDWDGRDMNGNTLPPGPYYARIETDARAWSEPVFCKIMIVK